MACNILIVISGCMAKGYTSKQRAQQWSSFLNHPCLFKINLKQSGFIINAANVSVIVKSLSSICRRVDLRLYLYWSQIKGFCLKFGFKRKGRSTAHCENIYSCVCTILYLRTNSKQYQIHQQIQTIHYMDLLYKTHALF